MTVSLPKDPNESDQTRYEQVWAVTFGCRGHTLTAKQTIRGNVYGADALDLVLEAIIEDLEKKYSVLQINLSRDESSGVGFDSTDTTQKQETVTLSDVLGEEVLWLRRLVVKAELISATPLS